MRRKTAWAVDFLIDVAPGVLLGVFAVVAVGCMVLLPLLIWFGVLPNR